jgi:hypothetical protein
VEGELSKNYIENIESLENVVMSMFTTSSKSYFSIMWFRGILGTMNICALFNSRSTYNFVKPTIL